MVCKFKPNCLRNARMVVMVGSMHLLNQAHAGVHLVSRNHFRAAKVCVCVCVCVSIPEAIKGMIRLCMIG